MFAYDSVTTCNRVQKRGPLPMEKGDITNPKRRKIYEGREVSENPEVIINEEFFKEAIKNFKSDPRKVLARNTIATVGILPAVTNHEEANKVNHIFTNTIKKSSVKATNQAHSGRCWMFAGLNIRHLIIKAMNLKNFEFSETYLYFYDKIERADWFMQEIIKYRNVHLNNHLDGGDYNNYVEHLMKKPMEDGGYWNFFANLVEKYGLIPKQAMEETANSYYSEEMNDQLKHILREAAFLLRNRKKTPEELEQIRIETIKKVTDMMIIFMGLPPEKFDWSFVTSDDEHLTLKNLTPKLFKACVAPGINFSEDFVVLGNYPRQDWPLNKVYEVPRDNNMIGGKPNRFLNLHIVELKKYAKQCILNGIPVWFAADVSKGFQPYKSALDEKLFNYELAFGNPMAKMTKGQRLLYQDTNPCHAMTLVGVNLDEKGRPTTWQVENSWGYWDNEEPGWDGYLTMSDAWFTENVFEIVVPKAFLTRSIKKLFDNEPTQLTSSGSAAQ